LFCGRFHALHYWCARAMADPEDSMRVLVRNTFVHIESAHDEENTHHRIFRSHSDPFISSSSDSENSSSDLPELRCRLKEGIGSGRVLASASASSSGTGYNAAVVPLEQVPFFDTGANPSGNFPTQEKRVRGDIDGPSWSNGADLHHLSQCKPCAWYWREKGCVEGASCPFCHLCGRLEFKSRRKLLNLKISAEKSAKERVAREQEMLMGLQWETAVDIGTKSGTKGGAFQVEHVEISTSSSTHMNPFPYASRLREPPLPHTSAASQEQCAPWSWPEARPNRYKVSM